LPLRLFRANRQASGLHPPPLAVLSDPGFFIPDRFAQKKDSFAALAVRTIGYDVDVFFGYGCPYSLHPDLIRNPSFFPLPLSQGNHA
jgi:hypothetical protein